MEKFELASDEWVDMFRTQLKKHIAELPPEANGAKFSMCWVFTDPPAHLDDGSGTSSYWIDVDVPNAEVGRGIREDLGDGYGPRYQDYQGILEHSREIVDPTDPTFHAKREAERIAAEEAGTRPPSKPPAELGMVFLDVHNYTAAHTA